MVWLKKREKKKEDGRGEAIQRGHVNGETSCREKQETVREEGAGEDVKRTITST